MRVVSVNVGQPREVETPRGTVLTSIFKSPVSGRIKSPVSGRIAVRGHNIEGDRQADLTVHGGPSKAIYAYSSEHYAPWVRELASPDLPFGNFGENLTTEGLTEERVHIGERYRIGSAVLQATQPRMPCFKLALRFGRADMVKLFWKSGRSGVYFAIVQEGELGSGDEIELVAAHPEQVSVADVVRVYKGETTDDDLFERVLRAPLHGSWKREIEERALQI
jgi:MOSC domain-containing protein YiiM